MKTEFKSKLKRLAAMMIVMIMTVGCIPWGAAAPADWMDLQITLTWTDWENTEQTV